MGVNILRKDGEAAAAQGRVGHEAHERTANEYVALVLGLALDELGGLVGELRVERAHCQVVLAGDKDGVEGGGRVDAVDHEGLRLHLAGRLLGELLEGEGRGEALGGGAE